MKKLFLFLVFLLPLIAQAGEYDGKIFDAMAQIDSGKYSRVLECMKDAHVDKMALFARINKSKKSGESEVLELKAKYPELFVIGVPKYFDFRDDVPINYVDETLKDIESKKYRFIGEILFAHGDKKHGEQTAAGERYVQADGKNVYKMMQALSPYKAIVMTHWEVYNWERDWPLFKKLYASFPQITFIWPHGGFGSIKQMNQVLQESPNVLITLSKREKEQGALSDSSKMDKLGKAMIDENGNIKPKWLKMIKKYPKRFLFATDAHKDFRWDEYEKIIEQYRNILGQLPQKLAYKIAWENAEKLYEN